MAGAVGNVKNIMPTLKGIPVTLNIFIKIKPVTGRNSNLIVAAPSDKRKFPLRLLKVNAPPIEINASGSATKETRRKVFSRITGKAFIVFEYTIPARHEMINGLVIIPFAANRHLCRIE